MTIAQREASVLYWYKGTVKRIVDGDTIELTIDLGFRIEITDNFRLFGINAPETRGATKEAGDAATAYLESLIPPGTELFISTEKNRKGDDQRGKYGRYLISGYKDGLCINDKMVEVGHAVYKDY